MANTLQGVLIFLHLTTLVCSITTADKKEDVKVTHVDARDDKVDLETQETGWIFDPIKEKARTLEYLKDKIFVYPFSALKSTGTSFSGHPIYHSGSSYNYHSGYAGSYPTYSFKGSGSHYPSFKPKQFNHYNPVHTPYNKIYPSYPSNSGYNKNYFSSGGYHINTATYAPDCYYSVTPGPTFYSSTTSGHDYSSGTPLHYHYSDVTPSHVYGPPGFHVGAKSSINVPSTPAPISHSSHFQSFYDSHNPSSYILGISSGPQYSDESSHTSGSSPSFPGVPSLTSTPAPPQYPGFPSTTYAPPSIPSGPPTSFPSFPSTPSSPTVDPSGLSHFSSSVPTVPSSTPVPIVYGHGDEGHSQEVVITPPPNLNGHYVTSLPSSKTFFPEPSYLYNQPPSYALSYYPNVFYITNEQKLEKTTSNQSVTGTHDVPTEVTSGDSSTVSTPTTSQDSQSTTTESTTPSSKSQSSVQTLPGPGLASFYSSQTVDQTRIPVPYNLRVYVIPQSQGAFYSTTAAPSVYNVPSSSSGSGSYVAFAQAAPAAPLTHSDSSFGHPLALGYNYDQPPIGYQITRTSKNC